MPPLAEGRAIVAADKAADGSLLSAGLAFRAIFAVLPALLLLSGLLGLLVDDPLRRAEVVASALRLVPGPVIEPFRTGLEGLAEGARAFSIVGSVALAWGASGFYGQLDAAVARLIPGPRRRGALADRVRGLGAIVAVAAAVVLASLGGAAWSFVASAVGLGGFDLAVLAEGLAVATLVLAGLDFVVYRAVPVAPPSAAAAIWPALGAGFGQAVLTVSFAFLAPWLVGSLAAFGALVGLLAAMIWLQLVARLLVIGAVWARRRRDRSGAEASPPLG